MQKFYISYELLQYLSKEYGCAYSQKMTRTKAFLFLIERYIKKKNEGEEMKESIDSLADIFKWSRPSVSKFISYLHQHDIVKIKLSKNKKVISFSEKFIIKQ